MVVHSASRFMQRIGKKPTQLQFQHTNYVCFDAYRAKHVQLPSVDVDKHHDGCPSK